jgi:hypothetical protein
MLFVKKEKDVRKSIIICGVKKMGLIYCVFFSFFPVCGIYRSPWLCNCGSLVAMWAGICHLRRHKESKQQLLAIFKASGSSLFPNVLAGPALHLSRRVSA